MAMENKRIIQLSTERTTLGDDDYTIVDSDTNGTAKYRLSRLKETDTTLSVSGMAADAAATGQAINAETQARTQAVAAETQARQQAISAESQARAAADTTLGNDVDDLKSAIGELNPVSICDTDFFDRVNYGIPENVKYTHNWADDNGHYNEGDSTTNSLVFKVEPSMKYYIYAPSFNRWNVVETSDFFSVGSNFPVSSSIATEEFDGVSVISFTSRSDSKYALVYFYFGAYDYESNKNSIKIFKGAYYKASVNAYINEQLLKKKFPFALPKNTDFFDNVNYFDPEYATYYTDRFVSGTGKITKTQDDAGTIVIPVQPNKNYWFYAPSMNRAYVVEGEDDYFFAGRTYNSLYANNATSAILFTTGASAKFVAIYFYSGTYDYETNKNGIILCEDNLFANENPVLKRKYLSNVLPIAPRDTDFFDGINYYNISTAIFRNNIFVNENGYVVSNSGVSTLIVPVEPSTTYWFYAPNMNRGFVAGNDTQAFIPGTQYTSLHALIEEEPFSFTTLSNIHYVAIYFYNDTYNYDENKNGIILCKNKYSNRQYIDEKYIGNPIFGKNILIFGDSITDCCRLTINSQKQTTAYSWENPSNSYVDGNGNTVRYSMWPKILKESQPCGEIRNYALQGASYKSKQREEGFERQNIQYQIDVALNDLDNPNNVFDVDDYVPDIVIFALGTNDGVPNDTYESAMNATVYSGSTIDVENTISALDESKTIASARKAYMRIKQAFPMAQIYTVLPIQRAYDDVPIGELHEQLKNIGRRYGCIVIDGAFDCGITRDFNVTNTLGVYLKDGLHPNEKGQNLMARAIISSLKSHYVSFGTGFNQ